MKKLLVLLLVISTLCIGASASSVPVNEHEINATVMVVSENGEFILECASDIHDIDVLRKVAVKQLKNGKKSEIGINAIICCEPDSPKTKYMLYYHINLGNGYCETSQQAVWICDWCGADVQYGSRYNIKTHITQPSCP